jgi:hypothetical protein
MLAFVIALCDGENRIQHQHRYEKQSLHSLCFGWLKYNIF